MNAPKRPHITVINRETAPEVEKVKSHLSSIEKLFLQYNLRDVFMTMTNPKRLLWLNFVAGVARGLGLTVGTAIVLAILFFILKSFVSLPIIGEYINDLIDLIIQFRGETYSY